MTIYNKIQKRIKFIADVWFYRLIVNPYIKLFGSQDKRKLKYRISLCLIFNEEAPYLKEWLDYHLTIGIDHFYLYNNNSTDDYYRIIKPYINKGIITLIDWPHKQAQAECYKHCLDTFKHETNWIGYIDADEFVCPKYANDINDWIKDYAKYPAIRIDWLQFGTNGLIEHNYSKNVIEQYFSCWEDLWMGKTFVNTRYEVTNWNTQYFHHHSYMKYRIMGIPCIVPAVNQFKEIRPISVFKGNRLNSDRRKTIQINHYYSKSWDVFISKTKKSDVFFTENPKTLESFFYRELKCINRDYTILRFIQKIKLFQNKIEF